MRDLYVAIYAKDQGINPRNLLIKLKKYFPSFEVISMAPVHKVPVKHLEWLRRGSCSQCDRMGDRVNIMDADPEHVYLAIPTMENLDHYQTNFIDKYSEAMRIPFDTDIVWSFWRSASVRFYHYTPALYLVS